MQFLTMRRLFVVLIVLSVAGLGGYAAWHAIHPRRMALRLGTAPQIISGQAQIAAAFGDFAREGLDVTIVPYPSGKLALQAMLAGEVDLATVAETPLWRAAGEHRSLVLWATLAETRRSVWIIARHDRHVATPTDLIGKRIAVSFGTTAQIYLLTLLDLYGIERSRVEIVDVPPQDMAERLVAGDVDAGCIWEPFASKVERALDHPVIMHDAIIYRMTWNLVGRTDGPTMPVERVLRAIERANQRLRSDDPRVVDELARWCDLDRDVVRNLLPDHHFSLQLEGSLLVEIEEQAKLLGGPGATVPDMLPLIDPAPLRRFLPEAVSIPLDIKTDHPTSLPDSADPARHDAR